MFGCDESTGCEFWNEGKLMLESFGGKSSAHQKVCSDATNTTRSA